MSSSSNSSNNNNNNRPRSDSTQSMKSWSDVVNSATPQPTPPQPTPPTPKPVAVGIRDTGEFKRRAPGGSKAIVWFGWITNQPSDDGRMKRVLTDSFRKMETEFAAEAEVLQKTLGTGAQCPETVSIIWVPYPRKEDIGTYFIASGVKNTKMGSDIWPVNGPTAHPHPRFAKAIAQLGAVYHRTNFCCAEMHAVNFMLREVNSAKNEDFAIPAGTKIYTFGYPESGGAKAFMWPCEQDKGDDGKYHCAGCRHVLNQIGGIAFSGDAEPNK